MPEYNKLKNCIKFPTSIIIRGEDLLGIELAKSLLEQGGFVILIDNGITDLDKYLPLIDAYFDNLLILDYSGIVSLKQDLRRLDYVFYLNHQAADFSQKISTQEFLQSSNYLDAVLDLTAKFDAKFLLTTSIKAHQLLVSDKVIDLNYAVDADARYSVYSELEIQRYAESLVKEYQEKVGVNARVVRLGTLLGKGMEINIDTNLVQLILAALAGKNLVIPGDGLESDYYIHYLDAAYGIIKAQFTPNTKGQIYTLANEEEVTVLSLAYKLLELIPTAKEIQFNQDDNNLPPIKLYKPAQNLVKIGWRPRIAMERALKQTIDFIDYRIKEAGGDVSAINQELIPINRAVAKAPKTFKDKLLDFFFIAEEGQDTTQAEINARAEAMATINTQGALARLIAERKRQEQARRGNIIIANNQLRESIKPKPKLNSLQKLDNALSTALWNFKGNFEGLKNMSVTDFVFMLVGIGVFLGLYFTVISPVLSFGRNLFIINDEFNQLVTANQIQDFSQAQASIKVINSNLKQSQDRMLELQSIFKIFGKDEAYRNIQLLISNSMQFTAGMDSVYLGLEPWQEYLESFYPGFMQRLDGSTHISVDGSQEYSEILTKINRANSELVLNLSTNIKLLPQIEQGLQKMPLNIYDSLSENLLKLEENLNGINAVANITPYSSELLGANTTKNYLLIIQDNYRYTVGGGEVAGLIWLEVTNGAVKDIKVVNWDQYANATASFNNQELSELKLSASRVISTTNAKQKDVALIADDKVFLNYLQKYFEQQFSTSFDMVISVNNNTLTNLIGDKGITIRQENLIGKNLASYLANKLPASVTVSSRNAIILDMWAVVFEQRFNDLNENATIIANVFSQGLTKNDVRLYSTNVIIQKLLTENIDNNKVKDKIFIGANYDQKTNTLATEPTLTLSGSVNYLKNGEVKKDFILSANGFDSLENLVVCVPYASKDLLVTKAAPDLITQVISYESDKSCVILLENADLKYGISYYNVNTNQSIDESSINKLELITIPGIEVLYDIEFVFESGTNNIIPDFAGFSKQSNGFLYRGSSNGSNLFIFSKN